MSDEDAHWQHFMAHFLRISHMRLGKLNVVLDFSPSQIDRDIPTFHKELLPAWDKHKHLRIRTHLPEKLPDILNEPLFKNELVTVDDQPLFRADWIAAGLTQVKDICYEAVPGYLQTRAIHELLTENDVDNTRTLLKTSHELQEINAAIPHQWNIKITTEHTRQSPDQQPRFGINDADPGNPPTDILACKTRHFYAQLHKVQQTFIPNLNQWKRTLQPEPTFNAKQWKTLYPPLATNRQGDLNLKIAHRVVHTALSLNRMGVWATSYCHRCGALDLVP